MEERATRTFGVAAQRIAIGVLLACMSACGGSKVGDPALDAEQLLANLKEVRAGVEVGGAHETPIQGLVGVKVGRGNVIYGTPDGRYIVAGDLFEVKSYGLVNLTERLRTADRKLLIASLDPATTITYSPADDVRAVINVFTDISCGFCKEFHTHIEELVEQGVEVRYVAFPRAGVGSDVYKKMVSVWCADDPAEALTKAKLGEEIGNRDCENPVADHHRLGKSAGVGGTPGTILPDGQYIAGFDTVAKMLEDVGIDQL